MTIFEGFRRFRTKPRYPSHPGTKRLMYAISLIGLVSVTSGSSSCRSCTKGCSGSITGTVTVETDDLLVLQNDAVWCDVQAVPCAPLTEVIVSDSIPLSDAAKACTKIKQISIARLLGEAIKRIHSSDSVSSLFA